MNEVEETSFWVNDRGLVQTDNGRTAKTVEDLFGVSDRNAAAKKYEGRANVEKLKAVAIAGLGPKSGVLFLKAEGRVADEWDCLSFRDRGVSTQRFYQQSGGEIMMNGELYRAGVEGLIGTNRLLQVADLERTAYWTDRKESMNDACGLGVELGKRLEKMRMVKATDVAGFHWLSKVPAQVDGAMSVNVYDRNSDLHVFTIHANEIDHTFSLRDGGRTVGVSDDAGGLAALARKDVGL